MKAMTRKIRARAGEIVEARKLRIFRKMIRGGWLDPSPRGLKRFLAGRMPPGLKYGHIMWDKLGKLYERPSKGAFTQSLKEWA